MMKSRLPSRRPHHLVPSRASSSTSKTLWSPPTLSATVVVNTASFTSVLVGGTVNGLFGGGGGVDGRHQSLDNAKLVMDDFGEGSKTVRCARGVGNLYRYDEAAISVMD